VVAAVCVVVSASATAAPTARQRVAIVTRENQANAFALTPFATGAVKRDSGLSYICCFDQSSTMRDGQAISSIVS
jgi:hypothetical protein